MTKKRIHMLYSIVLSTMLAISGICLCIACVGIYLSGKHPFSPEAVAGAFRTIAVPVYLCLALVIGGFLLERFCPGEKKKTIAKQEAMLLMALQAKLDEAACTPEILAAITARRQQRSRIKSIGLALLILCSAVFLSYGLNPANFHQSEINTSMLRAMVLFFPCLVIPFAYGIFAAYAEKKSIRQEIELIRQALSEGARAQTPAVAPRQRSGLLYVRLAILCVGIAILVYGFFAGGTADVMTKAINICTECVGLG